MVSSPYGTPHSSKKAGYSYYNKAVTMKKEEMLILRCTRGAVIMVMVMAVAVIVVVAVTVITQTIFTTRNRVWGGMYFVVCGMGCCGYVCCLLYVVYGVM